MCSACSPRWNSTRSYAGIWAVAPGSGWGCCGWGVRCMPLVREAALPALRALAEDIGATAHLTLVDGTEALAVAVVEPTSTSCARRLPRRVPSSAGAGSAGRAILAARQPGPADAPGYTLTHGELEAGASGAAAPLIGVTGVEGGVGVVMLADSVPERVGPRVVDAAREVAERAALSPRGPARC